jgi:hypothetical protein
MGFEERFSKVGRAIDDAGEKVRDTFGGDSHRSSGRMSERWDDLKRATHAKSEELWEKYKTLPKAVAAAYALGTLCLVLVVALLVTMSSGSSEVAPSKAKADEIATMAALRAKMSPNAIGRAAPK